MIYDLWSNIRKRGNSRDLGLFIHGAVDGSGGNLLAKFRMSPLDLHTNKSNLNLEPERVHREVAKFYSSRFPALFSGNRNWDDFARPFTLSGQ